MTRKGKKLEPPVGLDMPFDEAMHRFIQTDPKQVEASIARSKKKKPGGKKAPPGTLGKTQSVILLRDRRMKKRNGR